MPFLLCVLKFPIMLLPTDFLDVFVIEALSFNVRNIRNLLPRARHSSKQQGDKFLLGSTYPPLGKKLI